MTAPCGRARGGSETRCAATKSRGNLSNVPRTVVPLQDLFGGDGVYVSVEWMRCVALTAAVLVAALRLFPVRRAGRRSERAGS